MKEKIKEEIKNLADQKYMEFHKKLCPGTDNIIGVRVPVLRNYAKNLIKYYSLDELLENIDNEYYEEVMLQGMLIGLETKGNFNKILKHIENFIPKIDNWAICDVFCAGLKITKKHKSEMWEFIQKYLKSRKEFEVRFGVVMILDFYIEQEKLEEVLKILNEINHEGYYVKMAVAWAISICLIKFYNQTLEFLNNCSLDKFTYQKALQKAIESYRLTAEQKDQLRAMKQKN